MHASRLPVQEQAAVHTCRGTEEERAIRSRLLDRLCVTEISYRTIPIDPVRAACCDRSRSSHVHVHSSHEPAAGNRDQPICICMHACMTPRFHGGPDLK